MPEAPAATVNRSLLSEWELWLRHHHYAPSTIYGYVRIVTHLLAAFPTTAIERFTAEHIERHLETKHLAPLTYNTQVETLSSFFGWLRRHKRLIRRNPCAGVDLPPPHRLPRHAVTPSEFAALCKAARRLEELVGLHLMYYSGLRINELRHVRVGDLDLARRLLRVRVGKATHRSGPRPRWTVLHPQTVPLLRLWLWRSVKLHPDLYLLGRGAKPVYPQGIRQWFGWRRVAAGLPAEITPHTLRHGFVKLLKLHGASLELAANLAGHESLDTTRRIYGALSPEELRDLYDRALFGLDKSATGDMVRIWTRPP